MVGVVLGWLEVVWGHGVDFEGQGGFGWDAVDSKTVKR